ncbi:MAG: HlyD family efflux transporter periplasmic adaptor subunit [Planctomycetota bacterium]
MTHSTTGHQDAAHLVRHATQGEGSSTQILSRLLEVQAQLGEATAGAVLRLVSEKDVDILAAWPESQVGRTVPLWIARAAEAAPQVVRDAQPLRIDAVPGTEDARIEVIPLAHLGESHGVVAFLVPMTTDVGSLRRLELASTVLGLHQLRLDLVRRQTESARLTRAVDVAASVSEAPRFKAAALALVGEVAAHWRAERASLGMLPPGGGSYVRIEAMSNTDKLVRKMQLVRDIESVMEECIDQDIEVMHPSPPDAPVIAREARELSDRHGPTSVLSLPLRDPEGPVGALTVERAADEPFVAEEVEALRLVLELCTARLTQAHQVDRWFGARLASWSRRSLATIVGPEHTWAKVAVALLGLLVLISVLVRGTDYATGQAVVQPESRRVVPAPYDGYLRVVHVRAGDAVVSGETVLAELDDSTLRLELSDARAERRSAETRGDAFRSAGKIADAQIADAQVDEADARIRLLEHRLAQSKLIAPTSGMVISGDVDRLEGSPVRNGQPLFEIASDGALMVELATPEARIGDVQIGHRGEITLSSAPSTRIPIEIERIEPIAVPVEGSNVFRLRATLLESPEWLKPGMEGIGRVDVGERSLARLWTRDLVNWVRMRLWL